MQTPGNDENHTSQDVLSIINSFKGQVITDRGDYIKVLTALCKLLISYMWFYSRSLSGGLWQFILFLNFLTYDDCGTIQL